MQHRCRGGAVVAAALSLAVAVAQAAPDTFTATRVDRPASATGGFYGVRLADDGAVLAEAEVPTFQAWYTDADGVGVHDRPAAMAGYTMRGIVDLNAAGQVLGVYVPAPGAGVHGFVTGAGGVGLVDLGVVSPSALDDRGRAVGTVDHHFGFRSTAAGTVSRLGSLGRGYVFPAAIRGGVVVGEDELTGDVPTTHAFRTGSDGHALVDLGTLVPGGNSSALALNTAGLIVGSASDANGVSTAVAWTADGAIMSLDGGDVFFNSIAVGVDAAGHVCGHGDIPPDPYAHPFITGANGVGLASLNRLVRLPNGSRIGQVVAMNQRGQILAMDILADDGPWLLTPTRASWASEVDAEAR